MVTDDTEKLPIVIDDASFAIKGGILQLALYARITPLGAKAPTDEERICVSRIALGPEMVKVLIDGLENAQKATRAGKLELVN